MPEDVVHLRSCMSPIFEAFRENSGFNGIRDEQIIKIVDTVVLQKRLGLEPPSWFKPWFDEALEIYLTRAFALLTETQEMKRLKSGPLITEILDYMNNRTTPVGALVYSGLDATISGLARSLKVDEQLPAIHDYGAALTIELHTINTTEPMFQEVRVMLIHQKLTKYHLMILCILQMIYYYIKVSDTSYYSQHVRIPNCTEPCSLEEFTKNMEYFIVRNPEELCEL